MQFNHAYTFAFSLESNSPDGRTVTANELRHAIIRAAFNLHDYELIENCGLPFDTYEIETNSAADES